MRPIIASGPKRVPGELKAKEGVRSRPASQILPEGHFRSCHSSYTYKQAPQANQLIPGANYPAWINCQRWWSWWCSGSPPVVVINKPGGVAWISLYAVQTLWSGPSLALMGTMWTVQCLGRRSTSGVCWCFPNHKVCIQYAQGTSPFIIN